MSELKWVFPPAHLLGFGGESTGDIESMKGGSLATFIREMIQNSLDAKRDNSESVEICFQTYQTEVEDFPGYDSFAKEIDACKKSFSDATQRTKASFINNLSKQFSVLYVDWIRISDYGTTGLIGVSQPTQIDGNPWMSFTKGSGHSTKDGAKAGSKGIGKNTAFVNSSIRTIFVSTITEKGECGFQGLSKLIARQLEGDYTNGAGFYGDGVMPAAEYKSFDPSFTRSNGDFGTDIFIPFFRTKDDLEGTIARVAMDSFMPAILNGLLVVRIGKKHVINKSNIAKYVAKYAGENAMGKMINEEFRILTSRKSALRVFERKQGSKVSMTLTVRLGNSDECVNKVFVYRTPGIKVHTAPVAAEFDYSAILMIAGRLPAAKLRCLENATHTKWDLSTVPEEGSGRFTRAEIKAEYDQTMEFIVSSIDKIQNVGKGGKVNFGGLSGFFRELDVEERGSQSKRTGLPSAQATLGVKPRRKKKPLAKKNSIIAEDGSVEDFEPADGQYSETGPDFGSSPEGRNRGYGGEPHPGEDILPAEDGTNSMMRSVSMASARKTLSKVENGFLLRFMTDINAISVVVEIKKVGIAGDNEPLTIDSVESLDCECSFVDGNLLIPEIERNKIYTIFIKSSELHNYAWEVELHGYEK